jgi:hypothetical protein
MILNARTISILKNFATINRSIVLTPGNTIQTCSPSSTMLAKAHIEDSINGSYGIYNLSQFISALTIFQNPELEFSETSVKISDFNRSITYSFCDPSFITSRTNTNVEMSNIAVSFTLSNKDIQDVTRALGILDLFDIAITGDGSNITIQAFDTKGKTENNFCINLGATDKVFQAIFSIDSLKILPDNYQVQLSSDYISHFKGSDVEYWIAMETGSSFNKQ